MGEPVVCIFPHSDDEFPTADHLRHYLDSVLLGEERNGEYWLGKVGWKDKDFVARVIPGSLVLFRKKGWVVGQATVQNGVEKLEPPEPDVTEIGKPVTYYHRVFFEPHSIKVFDDPVSVSAFESWCGRELDPRFYSIIGTRRAYEQQFGEI